MTLTTKRLSRLIKDLAHPDASKRRSAAEALSGADERAVYPLIRLLKDENPGVQDAAMHSIISIDGETTVYMILPLLRGEPFLRNTAVIILKEIGTAAVPLLQELFSDKDNNIRKFAIDLISEIGYCTHHDSLITILRDDPDTNVRVAAAKAIGALNYSDGVPHLIKALRDEEWVCFAALESLAGIADESAIEPILSLLRIPSEAVRYAAINTLGAIGSSHARDALIRHLEQAEGMEKIAAIRSLSQIGSIPKMPGVADALIELFTDGDWDDRLIALRGLVEIKEDRALPYIIDIAGSLEPSEPESEEKLFIIKGTLRKFGCTEGFIKILLNPSLKYRGRILAIDTIGEMGCENAVPSLMTLLNDRLNSVRSASFRALGKMNIREAQRGIITALEDGDGHIRREAVTALAHIGDKESVEPLLKILKAEKYNDVLEEAVKALLRIDPAVLRLNLNGYRDTVKEIIARYSQNRDVLLRLSSDVDLRVRVAALSRISTIHDDRVYKLLKEALHDPQPEIRRAAIRGMADMNCYEELPSVLKDKDDWVRIQAIKALGQSSNENMLEVLASSLDDGALSVVLSAIDAIANIGGKKALNVITPLLQHHTKEIREKAMEVIQIMQNTEIIGQHA